ncbi:MAG: TIGR01212 family radical SAM protein [Bacilli bacterium]|nr:TIGR01212 family radical SAM protein [Bacilli bacterium]
MFKYSDNNKRYHTLDYFYKHKFGCKIAKVSLNGGFTCPNKDGTKGVGGCIYCSSLGSGDFAGSLNKSIKDQFYEIKKIMDNKWENTKYIAYFQANTNTYASVDILKKKYEEALKIPNVVGLNIATRSDAITEECLNYLEELNKKTFLNIELGLQTVNKKTNELINRGETLEEFDIMVKKLRSRGINVIVHIINGLPYETKKDMINTIKYVNSLDIQGIKIHMLHIIKNTKLEELYINEKFHVLTREEYVNIVCDQLELLRPEIVINRITGDPKKEELIEPQWLLKKFCVLNEIDKEMKRRDSYQGIKA